MPDQEMISRYNYDEFTLDEGEIYVGDKEVKFRSPLDAIELGIGMVHQHRKLVSAHTVIENIILGHPRSGKILNLRRAEEEVHELCEKYGFKVDLSRIIISL